MQPLRQLATAAPELSGAALVPRFVASALAEWRRLRAERLVATEIVAAEPPSGEQLQPLVDLVEMRAPEDAEAQKLEQADVDDILQDL